MSAETLKRQLRKGSLHWCFQLFSTTRNLAFCKMPPNDPLLLWHLSCGCTRWSQFLFSALSFEGHWILEHSPCPEADNRWLESVKGNLGKGKRENSFEIFSHKLHPYYGFSFCFTCMWALRLLWNSSMCWKTKIQILVIAEEAHKGVVNHGDLHPKWQDNRGTGTGRGSVGFGSGSQLAHG